LVGVVAKEGVLPFGVAWCHAVLNEENAESLLSRGSPFLVILVLYEKRRIL
jgi:hypothetical protein